MTTVLENIISITKNPVSPEVGNKNQLSTDKNTFIDSDKLSVNECKTKDQNINNVWTMNKFNNRKNKNVKKGLLKSRMSLDLKVTKTSWATEKNYEHSDDDPDDKTEDIEVFSPTPSTPDKDTGSPSHHARRPMNAFLIFCKKHRPIVRQKFPNLENRGVTRILGEWWALLDTNDKNSYTNLAKEYKDAFFSANPGFKWYKLPAPPLRTLAARPTNVQKSISPLSSPIQTTPTAEFTPGKLADESQLGSITSLMNMSNDLNNKMKIGDNINSACTDINCDSNDKKQDSYINSNNNNVDEEEHDFKHLLESPTSISKTPESLPPKPIKKRIFDQLSDNNNKSVARNIFDTKPDPSVSPELIKNILESEQAQCTNTGERLLKQDQIKKETDNFTNGFAAVKSENITQQDLMNKVVDKMFPKAHEFITTGKKIHHKNGVKKHKETRKSGRSCKGKRYAEFMVEGKLLGNRHSKRLTQYKLVDVSKKFDNELINKIENSVHKPETQTPKIDLESTIKRLAERTNIKLEELDPDIPNKEEPLAKTNNRVRTDSEGSEDSFSKMQSYFNLDMRIAELPSLSYDTYLQRKKESKKRKSIRTKPEAGETKAKTAKLTKSEISLVGSKKRKNKNNITRLEKPANSSYPPSNFSSDLSGLATLAEVAANTEKIN